MKKFLVVLLSLAMTFSLAACGQKNATTNETATETNKVKYYSGMIGLGGVSEEDLSAFMPLYWEAAGIEQFEDGTRPEEWALKYYDSVDSAILALDRGDIEEYNCPKICGEYIIAKNPDKYRFAISSTSGSSDFTLSMAMLEKNSELLEKLNAVIKEFKADGTLDALEEKYCKSSVEMETVAIPTFENAETITFYVTGDMAPYDYTSVDGTPAGYNVALVSAIAEKLGVNVKFASGESGSRYIALTSGRADVVFYSRGILDTEGGEFFDCPEGVLISEPYTLLLGDAIVLCNSPR